jgi:hypothetical protein
MSILPYLNVGSGGFYLSSDEGEIGTDRFIGKTGIVDRSVIDHHEEANAR